MRTGVSEEVSSMPAHKLFVSPITEQEYQELGRMRRQAPGRVAGRAQMVLLSLRGFSVAEIARIFDDGEEVVRLWLHRFERRGSRPLEAVLDDLPRGGRPPKDRLAGPIVDAQAQQSPPCFGLLQTCWTVTLLAAHLAATFHLVLAPATVRRHLHRFRWRWGRPRLSLQNLERQWLRRDPERPQKLRRLARVRAWAARMPDLLHLVYVDESDLCLLPVLRACWQKVGQQLRIPTPGTANPKRTLFGALDALSGAWSYLVGDGRTSLWFAQLLERVERVYPTGVIVIALDSAPAHTAKRIQTWLAEHPRVRLLWLPKYTAHKVNPVEKIWWALKGTVAADRYYGKLDLLLAAAKLFFSERTPEDLLRLTHQQPMSDLWSLT
jgi:transposase